MKRIALTLALTMAAASALAADARHDKAKQEGEVAFYANITAVEPLSPASTTTH